MKKKLTYFLILSACLVLLHSTISRAQEPIDPTQQPQTDPTPQPQTDPASQPQTDPTPQPQPQPQPDPTPQPQTDPTPQPQTDPTPQPQTDPTPQPQSDPTPQPQTDPTPQPQPQPQADPIPQPQTDPAPQPQTDPTPQPQTDPTPQPQTDPAPQPQTDPTPQPQPQPDPTPQPQTDPTPQPQPQPDPTPEPQPNPTPQSQSADGLTPIPWIDNPMGTGNKFYTVNLANRGESDLIISVAANADTESYKVYVSKTTKDPAAREQADKSGENRDKNVVYFTSSELANTNLLYVGLVCSTNACSSEVFFEYSKEFSIEADGGKHIETAYSLGGATSAVVRLHIPDEPDVQRIVIHIDVISNNPATLPYLNVFLHQGNEVPFTTKAETIRRTSWFEGMTLILYRDTLDFCTNCDYTLNVIFENDCSLAIEAHLFEPVTRLGGYPVLDGAKSKTVNHYTYDATYRKDQGKELELVLDMKPQQGHPLVYINCGTKPSSFTSYYWKYDTQGAKEILLTQREHAQCLDGMYYIAVYTEEEDGAVYSLKVGTKTSNKLFLGKDDPVMGDIFPNEQITYEIFAPLFSAEEIILNLITKEDASPFLKMNVINCRFPTDCPNLLPGGIEFHNPQGDEKTVKAYSSTEFKYTTENDGKTVIIDPHSPEGCYPILIEDPIFMKEPVPVCAYQITLTTTAPGPKEYIIRADSKGHQWLFIGLPKLASSEADKDNYFVMNVPHAGATAVTFQVTKFSGDVDIYVSRSNNYPSKETKDTNEVMFSHEGMVKLTGPAGTMTGSYFINVHGNEDSSFAISGVVKEDNKPLDYALTLQEGMPQKGVLLPRHEHPTNFYKFNLNFNDQWEGTISLSVNVLRGQLLVLVNNNDATPMPNEHIWKAEGNQLQISSDDDNFKPNGTYYIGVFVDWKFIPAEDITYSIMYTVKTTKNDTTAPSGDQGQLVPVEKKHQNENHMFLSPLTPYHGSIKKGEVNFFEAFLLPRDQTVTLHKVADAGDVDIFVSVSADNDYPDEDTYDFTTQNTHKDFLELSREDLIKACPTETTRICTFYISVVPLDDNDEISYSLSMKRTYDKPPTAEDHSSYPLQDGKQEQFGIPKDNVPGLFYYYAVPAQPSVVTVSCPGKEIIIYANREAVKLGASSKPDVTPPTPEKSAFSSTESQGSKVGLAQINIPSEETNTTTIISIAVYFKDTDTPATGGDVAISQSSSMYHIIASSQMVHIYTGRPYHGYVQTDKYMYFYLNVFRPSSTLLISMTTLDDGDPDLVVSSVTKERPTIQNHQFASISKQRTEMIEISPLDVYPAKSMEGTWVIGVYGRVASSFSLTVRYEDRKVVTLNPGIPFEAFLTESSIMYFKFFHEQKNNINIKLDVLSGDLSAYVNPVKEGESIAENLPAFNNSIWKTDLPSDTYINIPSDDLKACVDCAYVIALESATASKFSIVVTEGEAPNQVQNGMRYHNDLRARGSKLYVMSVPNVDEVSLSINLRGPEMNVYVSQNPIVNKDHWIYEAKLTAAQPNRIMNIKKIDFSTNPQILNIEDGSRKATAEKELLLHTL